MHHLVIATVFYILFSLTSLKSSCLVSRYELVDASFALLAVVAPLALLSSRHLDTFTSSTLAQIFILRLCCSLHTRSSCCPSGISRGSGYLRSDRVFGWTSNGLDDWQEQEAQLPSPRSEKKSPLDPTPPLWSILRLNVTAGSRAVSAGSNCCIKGGV